MLLLIFVISLIGAVSVCGWALSWVLGGLFLNSFNGFNSGIVSAAPNLKKSSEREKKKGEQKGVEITQAEHLPTVLSFVE